MGGSGVWAVWVGLACVRLKLFYTVVLVLCVCMCTVYNVTRDVSAGVGYSLIEEASDAYQ